MLYYDVGVYSRAKKTYGQDHPNPSQLTIRLRHKGVKKKMSDNFTDRLRATRELRGLSQTDLAKRTGLQPSAISHFETGKRAPSFDNLKRLADALGASIDYLLGRSNSPDVATPVAEKIFRDFGKMTTSDQATLAEMAGYLAGKNAKKIVDPGE